VIRASEHATPRRGAASVVSEAAALGDARFAPRAGRPAAMNPSPHHANEIVARATADAAARAARHEHLWSMTREERVAAFYRGELTFSDCQAWSRRFPDEPPIGPCGEYLYILVSTPEWLGDA
jgi:hypothetical protein